jgi:prophage DNA circulation protein
MGSIRDIKNEWRDSLVMASFRSVEFHVEMGSMSSGRRTVVFEYPKRDLPYSEDMGRSARRWQFTAYLLLGDKGIKNNLMRQRDDLIIALEKELAGLLIHPDLGQEYVMCERYTYSEQRERGGYMAFDLQFVEAGVPVLSQSFMNSVQQMQQAADNAENTGMQVLEDGIADFPFVRGGAQ